MLIVQWFRLSWIIKVPSFRTDQERIFDSVYISSFSWLCALFQFEIQGGDLEQFLVVIVLRDL